MWIVALAVRVHGDFARESTRRIMAEAADSHKSVKPKIKNGTAKEMTAVKLEKP